MLAMIVTKVRSLTNNKTDIHGSERGGAQGVDEGEPCWLASAHRTLLSRLSANLRAYYKTRLARIKRSATEAEDLTQEALMAIHTRRHTHDPAEALTPWVYASARYKLIDHLRHTRASMTDLPIEDAEELMAQDDYVGTESANDLTVLLSELPDKMQRAIRAVKLDGLSVAEAASRCGMSESAVKVNVHRGLKALVASIAREKRI
jgi:RNA polymerase sigma-70 factor (ECF subfamily)